MGSVQDTDVCPVCGWGYWYEYDLRTGEYTKLTMCRCDIECNVAMEILKEHGLFEEYKRRLEEELKEHEGEGDGEDMP